MGGAGRPLHTNVGHIVREIGDDSRTDCEPYLRLRRTTASYEVSGQETFFRGHQLTGDRPDCPDGIFVGWHWDGQRLNARTCRYGAYPVYYYASHNEFTISPSLVMLLRQGAPYEWDEAALAVLVRFKSFVGEDTPFKAIRALPPAADLVWHDGQITILRRGSAFKTTGLSRDEAIDAYIETFRAAISRRAMPGSTIVPLSGGRDSRHILIELCRQGLKPDLTLTSRQLPPNPDEDAGIAAILARRLALPHIELPAARSRCQLELEKNLRTNFGTLEHAWFVGTADYVNRVGQTVYDGFGGGILSAGSQWDDRMVPLLAKGDIDGLSRLILGRLTYSHASEWALDGFLSSKWRRLLRLDVAVDRLSKELVQHLDAPSPMTSFLFWNRARRGIAHAPLNLYSNDVIVYMPYLDHAVFDLLMSLPSSMTADHNLHTDAIYRAFPQFRDIPFENKSAPPRSDPIYQRRLAFDVLRLTSRRSPSEMMRPGWLAPRLVEGVALGNADSIRKLGVVPFIYLQQLEQTASMLGG